MSQPPFDNQPASVDVDPLKGFAKGALVVISITILGLLGALVFTGPAMMKEGALLSPDALKHYLNETPNPEQACYLDRVSVQIAANEPLTVRAHKGIARTCKFLHYRTDAERPQNTTEQEAEQQTLAAQREVLEMIKSSQRTM